MNNVFTGSDCIELEVSALVLSVSPIVGGRVAVLAYAILSQGTYLISIVV
jgi:predicted S18 family serine protease